MNYIDLESVSLKYDKIKGIGFFGRNGSRIKSVEALHRITLRIREGENVALIGENGAGKSTLLRVMAGIFPPTSGKVSRSGDIFTFFGKSAGVNRELSGLDNIFLRGYFLGYDKRTIEKRFLSDIVDAIELGDRLDLPVKTYSIGMKARLSFGLNLFARGDIFLIDEGLGAGDAVFIEKARAIATRILSRSNIIVFASHSATLLKKFCNLGLVLRKGRMVYFGPLAQALDIYQQGEKSENPMAMRQESSSDGPERRREKC